MGLKDFLAISRRVVWSTRDKGVTAWFFVVKILVVSFHVATVGMGNCDVVGEFCTSQDSLFSERGSGCKESLRCIGLDQVLAQYCQLT